MPLRFIWGRMTISFLVAITQHQPNLTHIPAIDSAPLKRWIIMKTRLRCVGCLTTVLSIVNVGLLSTASQYCRKWTHYLSLMGWHGLNLSPKPAPWTAHPHGSAGTYEQIVLFLDTSINLRWSHSTPWSSFKVKSYILLLYASCTCSVLYITLDLVFNGLHLPISGRRRESSAIMVCSSNTAPPHHSMSLFVVFL